MILTPKKLSLFKDWNIDMILYSKELHSKYSLVSLERIIKPRKEKVKVKDIPKDRLIVSKIRFADGHVFFKDRVIKNDMNKSCINDLLVSNINFEKGAFAVNVWGDLYASTDYTSYVIDTTVIKPEYLFLALRCSTFMEYVASVKPKGMKTRARYEFIKNFEIPVPSIPEQELLLKDYHNTLDKAERNMKRGNDFGSSLLYDIQSKVSNLKKEASKANNSAGVLQATSFATTSRWEVDYILKEGCLESVYDSFKYPSYSISQLQEESLFGLSIKASLIQKEGMIPVLRMPNIINGEIDCAELKYLPYKSAVTVKEPQKWLLKKGDFLINRTNSKELVGKSAIFNLDGDYTYASYVIRYRFDTSIVIPEYVNIMFMLPIVRKQIDAVSRQTAGQCNINSDEIGAIRIPVPSLQEQQAIINDYNSTKDGSKKFYEKAKELKIKAAKDFEKAIFL